MIAAPIFDTNAVNILHGFEQQILQLIFAPRYSRRVLTHFQYRDSNYAFGNGLKSFHEQSLCLGSFCAYFRYDLRDFLNKRKSL